MKKEQKLLEELKSSFKSVKKAILDLEKKGYKISITKSDFVKGSVSLRVTKDVFNVD